MRELLTLLTLYHTHFHLHTLPWMKTKTTCKLQSRTFKAATSSRASDTDVIFKVSIALLIQAPNVHQMPNINTIYNLSSTFVI